LTRKFENPSHYLSCATDTGGSHLYVPKHESTSVMIPLSEYGKPLYNMEVAKCIPIRHPVEPEVVTYGPRGASSTVTPTDRPLLLTNTAGVLPQGAIADHVTSLLVAASRSNKNPTPTTGMILTPNCNNQICAIAVWDSTHVGSYLLTIIKLNIT
jgi:hypothetical protein